MEKNLLNYETLLKITQRISMSREFDDIALLSVTGVRDALEAKGCALFLINPKTQELELASSTGLSHEYLHKGPVSALRSIADSLKEGPVAIYDVKDDPRIQYPAEAVKEGIAIPDDSAIIVSSEGLLGGTSPMSSRARAVASRSWPAKTVTTRSGWLP